MYLKGYCNQILLINFESSDHIIMNNSTTLYMKRVLCSRFVDLVMTPLQYFQCDQSNLSQNHMILIKRHVRCHVSFSD